MVKVKGYLLGDGLKKGNQMLRKMEKDAINKLGTIELFNPWDQPINDKSKAPTAEMIFSTDTKAILDSEIIVCDADNNSVGSTTEIGQIWGLNFMLGKLHEILLSSESDKEVADNLEALLQEIPMKKLYWQHTDIRHTDIKESGMRRSHSINQYLYGCLLDVAGDVMDFEDILEELKKVKPEETN
ncbi:MAG: hypothetical protein ACQEUT_18075 [Bacillota bacterium]